MKKINLVNFQPTYKPKPKPQARNYTIICQISEWQFAANLWQVWCPLRISDELLRRPMPYYVWCIIIHTRSQLTYGYWKPYFNRKQKHGRTSRPTIGVRLSRCTGDRGLWSQCRLDVCTLHYRCKIESKFVIVRGLSGRRCARVSGLTLVEMEIVVWKLCSSFPNNTILGLSLKGFSFDGSEVL